MALTLQQTKKHLRVEHDEDDETIQGFMDAAMDFAERYTRQKLQGENAISYGKSVDQALLLIIGDWYEHRENILYHSNSGQEVPVGAIRLLNLYRLPSV